MAEMRNTLADLIGQAKLTMWGKSIPTTAYERLFMADWLIDNGVIVLPCKVGTPVFIINKKGQIFPGKFRLDDIDQFGKRVFLTKSEAGAALKAE